MSFAVRFGAHLKRFVPELVTNQGTPQEHTIHSWVLDTTSDAERQELEQLAGTGLYHRPGSKGLILVEHEGYGDTLAHVEQFGRGEHHEIASEDQGSQGYGHFKGLLALLKHVPGEDGQRLARIVQAQYERFAALLQTRIEARIKAAEEQLKAYKREKDALSRL